jgi:hypothetical protein
MSNVTHDPTDTSIVGRLRAKRRAASEKQTIDLPIPGYDGELVVRYRLLDPLVEGKELGDRIAGEFRGPSLDAERGYYLAVDTLIAACVAIFAKVNGDLVPIAGEGTITSFEDTDALADLLAFDPLDTARKTVEAVFVGNKVAINGQSVHLNVWMLDPSRELDRGLFG